MAQNYKLVKKKKLRKGFGNDSAEDVRHPQL